MMTGSTDVPLNVLKVQEMVNRNRMKMRTSQQNSRPPLIQMVSSNNERDNIISAEDRASTFLMMTSRI